MVDVSSGFAMQQRDVEQGNFEFSEITVKFGDFVENRS